MDDSARKRGMVSVLVPPAHRPHSERADGRNEGAAPRVGNCGGSSLVIGVAAFDARDALLRAIASAKTQQVTIVTTCSPAYDHEILTAADVAQSSVPRWT